MAIKISELPTQLLANVSANDVLPITDVETNITRKVSAGTLTAYVQSNLVGAVGYTGSTALGYSGSTAVGYTGSKAIGYSGSSVIGYSGSSVIGYAGSVGNAISDRLTNGYVGSTQYEAVLSAVGVFTVPTAVAGINSYLKLAPDEIDYNLRRYLQVRASSHSSTNIYLDSGDNLSYDITFGDSGKHLAVNRTGEVNISTYFGGYNWTFDTTGQLSLPATGNIFQNNSYTRTTNPDLTAPSAVVWTSTANNISSAKLTIQLEADQTGDTTGWHSQACEATIASRGYASGFAGPGGEPVMTVYGVVYTSTAPLVTFTVQRNATNKLIEVVATKTAACNSDPVLRIHSVELTTRD